MMIGDGGLILEVWSCNPPIYVTCMGKTVDPCVVRGAVEEIGPTLVGVIRNGSNSAGYAVDLRSVNVAYWSLISQMGPQWTGSVDTAIAGYHII